MANAMPMIELTMIGLPRCEPGVLSWIWDQKPTDPTAWIFDVSPPTRDQVNVQMINRPTGSGSIVHGDRVPIRDDTCEL
jgi:hypothetical protein